MARKEIQEHRQVFLSLVTQDKTLGPNFEQFLLSAYQIYTPVVIPLRVYIFTSYFPLLLVSAILPSPDFILKCLVTSVSESSNQTAQVTVFEQVYIVRLWNKMQGELSVVYRSELFCMISSPL